MHIILIFSQQNSVTCRVVRMIGFIGILVTISLNHIQYSAVADLHSIKFTDTNTVVLPTIYSSSAVSSLDASW
jgi:hypothetical protein